MVGYIEDLLSHFGLEQILDEMVQKPYPSLQSYPILPNLALLIVLDKSVDAIGFIEVLYFEPSNYLGHVHANHKVESSPRKAYKLLIDPKTNEVQIIREFGPWETDYFSANQSKHLIPRKDVYFGRPELMNQMIEHAKQNGNYFSPHPKTLSIGAAGFGFVVGATVIGYAISKNRKDK